MSDENTELEAERSLSDQLNAKSEDEVSKDFEAHLAQGSDDQGEEPEQSEETEKPTAEGGDTSDDKPEEQAEPEPKADVPFHKHPRFQQLVKERDEEREARAALENRLNELETKQDNSQPKEIPTEFVTLFGDNPQFYEMFSRLTQREAEKMVESRLSELEAERSQADNQQKEAQSFIENALTDLADETGLDLTNPKCSERNEIMDIAVKYRPIDDKGNIDMTKAYELWKQLKPKEDKSDAQKQLASSTVDKTKKVAPQGDKPVNFGDLRGKSVIDFIK